MLLSFFRSSLFFSFSSSFSGYLHHQVCRPAAIKCTIHIHLPWTLRMPFTVVRRLFVGLIALQILCKLVHGWTVVTPPTSRRRTTISRPFLASSYNHPHHLRTRILPSPLSMSTASSDEKQQSSASSSLLLPQYDASKIRNFSIIGKLPYL